MLINNSLRVATIAAAICTGATLSSMAKNNDDFNYVVDRFADLQVLRYKVPDFENLSLRQKMLVYYLTEAALNGRDILWDQNGKHNLAIRGMLENVYTDYRGKRDDKEFRAFEKYLKQVWFGNGIHHHYSTDKFVPEFSRTWLETRVAELPVGKRPANAGELMEVIFNPGVMAKRVNQAEGQDLIVTSANNLYDGVTQQEVEDYYAAVKDTTLAEPPSYGLNARVVKKNGKVQEEVYKIGGLYDSAIHRIVENLNKAAEYAESPAQKAVIEKLVEFYTTGDLRAFDDYSILWVEDTASKVDFINGFIESYGDPLGMTGAWEGMVNFKNDKASHRTEVISDNAQWFEDHSPVDPRFRKEKVKGVSAKVITAAILAGDA